MNAIDLARELGWAIQRDERYTELELAHQAVTSCLPLQKKIKEFEQIRTDAFAELGKEEKSKEAIIAYDRQMKEAYEQISSAPEMVRYQKARGAFSDMIDYIQQIIEKSVSGENPDQITFQKEEESCSHNCASCSSSCSERT